MQVVEKAQPTLAPPKERKEGPMSPELSELVSEIAEMSGKPFPPRCGCFVERYARCSYDDYSTCGSPVMRDIMRHIVHLATFHPDYEVEAEELPYALFGDIGVVTLNALSDKDDVPEAVLTFLKAVVAQHPDVPELTPIQ